VGLRTELHSNIQFCTALVDKRPVAVFIDDEMIGNGLVEQVTEFSVKISGEYYMRSECKFNYEE
jgi:hypothetical protein